MKLRKILHIMAITVSSLLTMASQNYAKTAPERISKRLKKTERSDTRPTAEPTSEGAAGDPPPPDYKRPALRLDPALMASAERPLTMPILKSQTGDGSIAPSASENERYPWKKQIVTTTFWVGEKACRRNPVPNLSSSWDPQWARNYGGTDSPDRSDRSQYIPANFVPRQNPFYIALPYNDVERGQHKSEASQVIPWFKQAYQGQGKSVLKGRWIAIRYNNRIAYAQWEDCGPFRTDHWQYVFGTDRPKPNLNQGAGLDVSPAVRDYLGMNDTDVTDWRFVEFSEVPRGPWAEYGDNNTFVMNQRKAEELVAQTKAARPVTLRE